MRLFIAIPFVALHETNSYFKRHIVAPEWEQEKIGESVSSEYLQSLMKKFTDKEREKKIKSKLLLTTRYKSKREGVITTPSLLLLYL
jgi:hypothetical protein